MSAIISYLFSGRQGAGIDMPSVKVHCVETDPDKRARCLKHLLKANHVNYSIIYNDLRFDNHNVHILCSAYLLGATEDQLHAIYNSEIQELEPWVPSPSELIDEDWRDFLGDGRFQRAYLDFFEDKLAIDYAYDWRPELRHYLLGGERPLLHGLIGGLGHPLIHLAYAYEMDSREVAMEALALASSQYNFFHKYLDEASFTRPSPIESESGTPLQLLERLSKDERFAHIPGDAPLDGLEKLFEDNESIILEYWNALGFDEPRRQFELCQQAAVALFVATVRPGTDLYNFFVVHLLTTSHAVRVLLSFLPAEHHVSLVREWWLLMLAIFIIRGRPLPDDENLDEDLKGRTWKHVEHRALASEWSEDAHFVKALRAMKEAAETWGDVDERYLQSAVTFADNFSGWSF
ncbi:hypothetical protein ESCO_004745 [Escovopsis weberi]|uniref:Oxidoreductase AflY n=1 Tax=Escovopsis weberi TaxID=150374 RepID=A0A0N0RSU4_ESCWE|nr:hypothetical protein ESCO_004745 [Escovopsis weberi]